MKKIKDAADNDGLKSVTCKSPLRPESGREKTSGATGGAFVLVPERDTNSRYLAQANNTKLEK